MSLEFNAFTEFCGQNKLHDENQAVQLSNLNQQLSEAEQRNTALTNDKNGLTRSLAAAQDQAEAARKEASQIGSAKRDLENQMKMMTTKHEAHERQLEGEKQKVLSELHQAPMTDILYSL